MATTSWFSPVYRDWVKPTGQAAIFGVASYLLAGSIAGSNNVDTAMWGTVGFFVILFKRFLIDETVDQIRKPKAKPEAEKELKPWEVTTPIQRTSITVRHMEHYGEGQVWWYELPIPEVKLKRAAFHVRYLGGLFSNRYMVRETSPRVFTEDELKRLQHYLINNHAAKWRGGDRRGGVELLEDGNAMFDWFALHYVPSPTERKQLARIARNDYRRYDRYGQIRVMRTDEYRGMIDRQFENYQRGLT